MKTKVLLALALAACAPVAFAQTCASPLPMPSNMTLTGTTCGGEVGINMGGVILPHQSVVYTFTYADDAGAGVEPDAITVTGSANMSAIVSTDCAVAPLGGSEVGTPFSIETLTPGQSYVVAVTTDVSIPVPAGGPICADYSVTTDTLPVELQKFSVE